MRPTESVSACGSALGRGRASSISEEGEKGVGEERVEEGWEKDGEGSGEERKGERRGGEESKIGKWG